MTSTPSTPRHPGGLIRHRTPVALSTEPTPADPSSSWLPRPGTRSVVLVRVPEAAQDVQEAPEETTEAEAPEADSEAAQGATDTAPATRADVARLEGLVLQLLARDEERAATIARLEDVALSVLLDLDTLRQRVESWRAEDEAAAY